MKWIFLHSSKRSGKWSSDRAFKKKIIFCAKKAANFCAKKAANICANICAKKAANFVQTFVQKKRQIRGQLTWSIPALDKIPLLYIIYQLSYFPLILMGKTGI